MQKKSKESQKLSSKFSASEDLIIDDIELHQDNKKLIMQFIQLIKQEKAFQETRIERGIIQVEEELQKNQYNNLYSVIDALHSVIVLTKQNLPIFQQLFYSFFESEKNIRTLNLYGQSNEYDLLEIEKLLIIERNLLLLSKQKICQEKVAKILEKAKIEKESIKDDLIQKEDIEFDISKLNKENFNEIIQELQNQLKK